MKTAATNQMSGTPLRIFPIERTNLDLPSDPAPATVRTALTALIVGLAAFFGSAASAQHRIPLWRAATDRAEVYVLPTIHYGRGTTHALPPWAESALAKSGALLLEVDIERAPDLDALRPFLQFEASQTLADRVDGGTLSALDSVFRELGVSREQWLRLKPFAVMTVLSDIELKRAGFTEVGHERLLIAAARRQNKRVLFLETPADQIRPYESLTREQTSAMLALRAKRFREQRLARDVERIAEAWHAGDLTEIERVATSHHALGPIHAAITARTIYSRNTLLFTGVLNALREQRVVLLAIGAAHVYGENGILASLRRGGFAVEQLSSSALDAGKNTP